MAAAAGEDALRQLSPFLARAEEVASIDPRVAYYLRLYAWKRGQAVPNRSEKLNAILDALLTTLEREKPRAGLQDLQKDVEHVTQFGLKVFSNADTADRRGRHDAATALAFSAAATFMDTLRVFNLPLADEVEAKLKFAAWRAADLSRTLSLDRNIVPAAPAGPSPPQQPQPSVPAPPAATLPPSPPAALVAPPGLVSLSQPHAELPPALPPGSGGAPSLSQPGGYPSLGGGQAEATQAGWAARDDSPSAASPSPASAPWRPAWGLGVAEVAPGERVLYRTQGDSFVIATLVQVDKALDPPAFFIDVDGGLRNTEARTVMLANSGIRSFILPAAHTHAVAVIKPSAERLALPPRPPLRQSTTSLEDTQQQPMFVAPPAPVAPSAPPPPSLEESQQWARPESSLELPSVLQHYYHPQQHQQYQQQQQQQQPSHPAYPAASGSVGSGYVSLGAGPGPPSTSFGGSAPPEQAADGAAPPRSWESQTQQPQQPQQQVWGTGFEAQPQALENAAHPQQQPAQSSAYVAPSHHPPLAPGDYSSHGGFSSFGQSDGAVRIAAGEAAEFAPSTAPPPPSYMPAPVQQPADAGAQLPSQPLPPMPPQQPQAPPAYPSPYGGAYPSNDADVSRLGSGLPSVPGVDPAAAAAAAAAASAAAAATATAAAAAAEKEAAAAAAAAAERDAAESAAAAAQRAGQPGSSTGPSAGAGDGSWRPAGPALGGRAASAAGRPEPPADLSASENERVRGVVEAQKLCVHAVNSMRRDDVGEAVEALRSALKLLTGGGAGAAACAR